MKELSILKKKNVCIVYGVLAVLMLIGTLFDLQINNLLYNKTNFLAVAMSYYGLYPVVPCMMVTMAMLLRLTLDKPKQAIQYPLLAFNAYMVYEAIHQFVKLYKNMEGAGKIINLAVAIGLALVLAVMVYQKMDLTDRTRMLKIASVILLAGALQFILINLVIKQPWGRPRYRSIIDVEEMSFVPWYQAGLTEASKALIAAGTVAADEFKSFPSGHAGCGAMLVMLTYLSQVVPAWKKHERIFAVIGFAWIACTMLGRMIAGAHFLTDVTMGTLITWTLFVVMNRLILRGK